MNYEHIGITGQDGYRIYVGVGDNGWRDTPTVDIFSELSEETIQVFSKDQLEELILFLEQAVEHLE